MLWHRCFPLKFAKFLRTSFLNEHLWWLLLEVAKWNANGVAKWFRLGFRLGFIKIRLLPDNIHTFFDFNLRLCWCRNLKQKNSLNWNLRNMPHYCVSVCKYLSFYRFLTCYSVLVIKWRQVLPVKQELHLAQVNL